LYPLISPVMTVISVPRETAKNKITRAERRWIGRRGETRGESGSGRHHAPLFSRRRNDAAVVWAIPLVISHRFR